MSGDDEPGDDDQPTEGAAEQPFDAGEPSAVKKRETKAQLARRRADEWWRKVMADPIGRREVWGIIQTECHAFDDRFACGPGGFPQPEATWFEAGKQSFGLRLYQTLLARDPMNTLAMMHENDPRFAHFAPKES